MDPTEEKELAQQCLQALQTKSISRIKDVASITYRRIQGVWAGDGGIVELTLTGDGSSCAFIAKTIGSYRNVGDECELQDQWSYYNELNFYDSDLPDRICDAGATCPRPLYVVRKASAHGRKAAKLEMSALSEQLQANLRRFVARSDDGTEKDEGIICMTKLAGGYWNPDSDGIRGALTWLARLHALFWGRERAEAAVAAGVSDQAGFWHLENRSVELRRMSSTSPLRFVAVGLDERLKADTLQTMCHGDPKGANIMWDSETGSVSMYDFQWFGQAPPTKDLCYFFATAALNGRGYDQAAEEELLRFYHGELVTLLEAQGDAPVPFEKLYGTYRLSVVDYNRWIEGGFAWGNMRLIRAHTQAFLEKLGDYKALKSEGEYRDRIFECFPP